MDRWVKVVGACAAIGVFGFIGTLGNRALESYVEELVAQEAERQDVARAKEVEKIRAAQEAGVSKLAGIEALLRRQDDRAEREVCLETKYPDLEGDALRRRCDEESEARWRRWAREDSVSAGLLPNDSLP